MSEKVYDVPAEWAERAWVDEAKYEEMYARSLNDPDGVLGRARASASTGSSPTPRSRTSPSTRINVSIKWFEDGVTNVAYNCVDRHLPKRANQTAIIWEGDDPAKSKHITYAELAEPCRPLRQRAEVARRQEGRPRHDLSADDPRGGLRDARLRAHRRRSIRSCSAASRPTRSPAASRTPSRRSSSPPTRACAAAARCR